MFQLPHSHVSQLIELIEVTPANTWQLRAALELLGADVRFHQVRSPQELLNLLNRSRDLPRLLILDGQGNDDGMFVPEIERSLREPELEHVDDLITPGLLRKYIDLPGWSVINLCPMGGSQEMMDAFRHGNVANYIGANGYPDGATASLFAIHMADAILRQRMTFLNAWERSSSYEPDAAVFSLTTDSRHR